MGPPAYLLDHNERGYNREQIIGLFAIIAWVIQLGPDEDLIVWAGVKALEEERHHYQTAQQENGLAESMGTIRGSNQD